MSEVSVDRGDRVTLHGIAVNLALFAIKLALGFVTGSAGLIADGIHSASDVATDLVVLGGIHFGRRKPDRRHPYGHGRFETMAGALVAGALVLVGLYVAWDAVDALRNDEISLPGGTVVVVAAASVALKEWLYRRTAAVARRVGSAALLANAWHHRSDALSSIAVLAGGVGALLGWGHSDHLAGLVVGLMVAVAGVRTLVSVFHEFTEGGLSGRDVAAVEAALRSLSGVKAWHELRGRRVGRETFVDLHVLVDPTLTVVDAHRVSMEVEEAIRRACRRPVNTVVHIEPNLDELAAHHSAS